MNSLIPQITATGVKHAIIAFVAAFLAVEPVSNLIGMASGSQPVDVSTLRAAAVAAVAAVIVLAYHAWLSQPDA